MIENDIIDIQEKFLIDDEHSKIRGFVAAYDEDNNRLFLKENMIVISGRKELLKYLRRTPQSSDTPFFDRLRAFLDTSTAVTSPTMTFNSIKGSLGGLSHSGLLTIQNAMNNGEPVKIESVVNNQEGYTKIFKAGTYYYITDTTIDGTPYTVLKEALHIEDGAYYYKITQITNSNEITPSGTYFVLNNSVNPSRIEKTLEPENDLRDNKTVYLATITDAKYNAGKRYFYKDSQDGVEDYYESNEAFLRTSRTYYLKNIKDELDFELVECFKITFDPSQADSNGQTRFGSLGLYFPGSGEEGSDPFEDAILFSRVTFPPYSARTKLKFFYYLYF